MILSVVIPCYNHGQYIQDAIDSVLSYKDQPIEIIVVDDGSTDSITIKKMIELKEDGFHIVQQPNSGLAKARNAGISIAAGKYILPLDADNKIKADYIRKALIHLENGSCDIVYAKPDFFGDDILSRKFETKDFNGPELIFGNYIDACAIFRKEIWIKNQGYDENMPYPGLEDWDFWLNSYFREFKFHFINEELYEYRILRGSMIDKTNELDKENLNINYIIGKYGTNIRSLLLQYYSKSKIYDQDILNPLRSTIKYLSRLLTGKRI